MVPDKKMDINARKISKIKGQRGQDTHEITDQQAAYALALRLTKGVP